MCCQRKLVGLYAVGQVERRASLNKHADAVSRAEGARRVQSSVALGVSKVHLWALLMQGAVGLRSLCPFYWAVRGHEVAQLYSLLAQRAGARQSRVLGDSEPAMWECAGERPAADRRQRQKAARFHGI